MKKTLLIVWFCLFCFLALFYCNQSNAGGVDIGDLVNVLGKVELISKTSWR
jgi:hypothetical protein